MAQPGELAFTGKSECVTGAHRDLGVDQPGSLTDDTSLEPTYCLGEDGAEWKPYGPYSPPCCPVCTVCWLHGLGQRLMETASLSQG